MHEPFFGPSYSDEGFTGINLDTMHEPFFGPSYSIYMRNFFIVSITGKAAHIRNSLILKG
jgi:hypothetical protein